MPETSVVILNWNGKKFLEKCLDSVLRQKYRNYDIIFVDNNSQDESLDYIYKRYKNEIRKRKIIIITNKKNYGFAKGNNIGISLALRNKYVKYIVTLNNDTEVDSDWLYELVMPLKKGKADGACSNSTRIDGKEDATGGDISRGGIFFERLSREERVNVITGCSCIYTRKLIQTISVNADFFDPDFFCYYEDVDVSTRAMLAGFTLIYVPKSHVKHYVGASANSNFKIFYGYRNQILYVLKNFPIKVLTKYSIRILLTQILQSCYSVIKYKSLAGIKGKICAIRLIPNVFGKRALIQKMRIISEKEFDVMLIRRWI